MNDRDRMDLLNTIRTDAVTIKRRNNLNEYKPDANNINNVVDRIIEVLDKLRKEENLKNKKRETISELKLFIFKEFEFAYSPGLAFAIAENKTEAKKLIEDSRRLKTNAWGPVTIKPLDQKTGRGVSGSD